MAGSVTVNIAVKGPPLSSIGLPSRVLTVVFDSVSVSLSVPMPGTVNGGAVYAIGSASISGSSSPSRHALMPSIVTDSADPSSGTGASSVGTTAGGGIVTFTRSPVLITKSPTSTSLYYRGNLPCPITGYRTTRSG